MSFWVYILRCGDGSYYTGHTDDLESRLHQHQARDFRGIHFVPETIILGLFLSIPVEGRGNASGTADQRLESKEERGHAARRLDRGQSVVSWET